MIPYGRHHVDASDRRAVDVVLQSDWLTQGPTVSAFEKELARQCGSAFAVVVSNGTAALHLAYLAAGIGKGDEVITTPNTFVATANMLLAVGATPVFCDIRADTWNIAEDEIERLITGRTKAIVPVYFAGQPCDMDSIARIAGRRHLLVIADACHALGARYRGRPIGAFADMSVLSFHPVKSITTGEGGAILTDNKALYETMLRLRSHGIQKDVNGFNVMTELGYNYRLTDIQSALGLSQLKKLEKFISQRKKIADWYAKELEGIEEIILPRELPMTRSAWHIYVIRVRDPKQRLPLMQYLKKNGIGVNLHYPAVYSHPYYRNHGYARVALAEADRYHATAITIPIFPDLKQCEVRQISRTIKNFFTS